MIQEGRHCMCGDLDSRRQMPKPCKDGLFWRNLLVLFHVHHYICFNWFSNDSSSVSKQVKTDSHRQGVLFVCSQFLYENVQFNLEESDMVIELNYVIWIFLCECRTCLKMVPCLIFWLKFCGSNCSFLHPNTWSSDTFREGSNVGLV